MSPNQSEPEIRALSAEEIEAAAGGDIHIHVPGVFHFAAGDGHISVGVFGVGVGYSEDEGGFTFSFE
jgi:hypothetical protein